MSNKTREVVPKKALLIEIRNLRKALSESNDNLLQVNQNLAFLEEAYKAANDQLKMIKENNLFLGLYTAFLIWKGERRR